METTMAKRKTPKPKEMVLGMRGSEEWKAWLDGFAEHCRMSKVIVVDLALVDFARKMGYKPPPKR